MPGTPSGPIPVDAPLVQMCEERDSGFRSAEFWTCSEIEIWLSAQSQIFMIVFASGPWNSELRINGIYAEPIIGF